MRDWPRRHAEGLPRIKERYWNGIIVDRGHVRTDGETLDMINFSHDLCKGKLMVESGATTSVAGLRVFEHHHEDCQQNLGSAESDSQPTIEAPLMLAFASGQARSSLGVVNMPCCFAASWGSVAVHVLDAPGRLTLVFRAGNESGPSTCTPCNLGSDLLLTNHWLCLMRTGGRNRRRF